MKTTFDIVDIVWSHLNNSSLKTAINGVIARKRPLGSAKEDVIINALPAINRQIEACVVNVNIYVPNKPLTFEGKVDDSQPNTARMKQLATIAAEVLKEEWGGDWNFSIQQQSVIEDDESKSHYINFRLEFYSINILN